MDAVYHRWKERIENNYPQLRGKVQGTVNDKFTITERVLISNLISGKMYGPNKMLIGNLVRVMWFPVMIMILLGPKVCSLLGTETPALVLTAYNNQAYSIIGFTLISRIISSLTRTSGAFEVYLDNKLVFSALKEGRSFDISDLQEIALEYKLKSNSD